MSVQTVKILVRPSLEKSNGFHLATTKMPNSKKHMGVNGRIRGGGTNKGGGTNRGAGHGIKRMNEVIRRGTEGGAQEEEPQMR